MRLLQNFLIGVTLLSGIAFAQSPEPAAASQPEAPKPMPVVEYDSGVIIPMSDPWKRPGKDGTLWAVNGAADQGEFVVRFPFALEPTPTSLDELYERELKALKKDKSWKADKKSLSDSAPTLTAPSSFKTRQLNIVSNAKAAWTERHLFVETPEGKFVAIKCALPTAALSSGDSCAKSISGISMVPEAQLLSYRDRARATNIDTPCSVVNGEIDRYKAANPDKPLKDMYRFTMANGIFMSMSMGGKGSSMQNILALSRSFPDIVAGTEKTCREKPELKFSEALGEGIKSAPKPAK